MGDDDFDGLEEPYSEPRGKLDQPREDKQSNNLSSDQRRRLEEKLEQRRLDRQIADYEFE
ncbi:MAG: hypothetical protein KBT88_04355 [Gammaproteobacteria bacterium]|nr:hypothetical protein [Gammaproteobacteria bacterium]MBQ0838996.1 hypothetical protein [Gammaproteobacteria bacterium]